MSYLIEGEELGHLNYDEHAEKYGGAYPSLTPKPLLSNPEQGE